MDELIRECLREKCYELALVLRGGEAYPALVSEIEELAREAWAFRDEDDA